MPKLDHLCVLRMKECKDKCYWTEHRLFEPVVKEVLTVVAEGQYQKSVEDHCLILIGFAIVPANSPY